ncbi:hypothetical protein GTP91_14655 [Rugamonas sp. FT82W]|uniref:Addiction module protein n=1 Tax=Duganella vulcania TaxID=2692166 RepID=A0A845G440_9BURK|nr:hypothetical protein [Duganella vulcania]MYM88410.1 hypothetical protein [Duganella vulcania]
MDSRQKKQAEALAALSPADRARLDRLASLADVTPEHLWPDVWLYGFEDVEDGVRADLEAEEDIAAGRTIPNDEVMAEARRIVESYAKRKRNAG